MKIEKRMVTIRELIEDYEDNEEEGVSGYGGRLDIRPRYQREFVYEGKKKEAVIETVRKGFPLNTMYWAKTQGDDNEFEYELMDGQQRTVSICRYVADDSFAIDYRYFHNLEEEEQEQILDYELDIYICDGTPKEVLDWFRVINIASEPLTNQELLNTSYTGAWLADAKRRFSKTNCSAYKMASKYMSGSCIRQKYLETAISWIADHDGLSGVEEYMAIHQHDPNANKLWLYFRQVIDWVMATFPTYRSIMKGLPWGILFNRHGEEDLDPKELEERIASLLIDDDVTKPSGIYQYVLDGDERSLNIRSFTEKHRQAAYERQNGICASCGEKFEIEEMEADHITPWCEGGQTTADNCQMLCRLCNRVKGAK